MKNRGSEFREALSRSCPHDLVQAAPSTGTSHSQFSKQCSLEEHRRIQCASHWLSPHDKIGLFFRNMCQADCFAAGFFCTGGGAVCAGFAQATLVNLRSSYQPGCEAKRNKNQKATNTKPPPNKTKHKTAGATYKVTRKAMKARRWVRHEFQSALSSSCPSTNCKEDAGACAHGM